MTYRLALVLVTIAAFVVDVVTGDHLGWLGRVLSVVGTASALALLGAWAYERRRRRGD